jgi:hypothetical protein
MITNTYIRRNENYKIIVINYWMFKLTHRRRNNIREHKDDDRQDTMKKKHKECRFLSLLVVCLSILSVHYKMQEIHIDIFRITSFFFVRILFFIN